MKNIRRLFKWIKNSIENLTAATFLRKVSINAQGIKKKCLKTSKIKKTKNENIYKKNSGVNH